MRARVIIEESIKARVHGSFKKNLSVNLIEAIKDSINPKGFL